MRAYISNKFDYRDQVNGAAIRALYFDQFDEANGYSLEYTESGQGSCVMVPCTGDDPSITKITFTGILYFFVDI